MNFHTRYYKSFQIMSGLMLSPKVQRMQRSIRINDGQLLGLAEKARYDSRLAGFLYKRCADSNKWLLRWFRLYQVHFYARLTLVYDYLTEHEINQNLGLGRNRFEMELMWIKN